MEVGIASTFIDDLDDVEKAEVKRDMKAREANLTFMTNHPSFTKLKQTPLFKCSSGKKTTERVEDKLFVLFALEQNLKGMELTIDKTTHD